MLKSSKTNGIKPTAAGFQPQDLQLKPETKWPCHGCGRLLIIINNFIIIIIINLLLLLLLLLNKS